MRATAEAASDRFHPPRMAVLVGLLLVMLTIALVIVSITVEGPDPARMGGIGTAVPPTELSAQR